VLNALVTRLNIPYTWDVIIAGDGSGNAWNQPCGWSGILVDRMYRGRQLFFGGANLGSVNFAEAMPYLTALTWYDANVGKRLLKQLGSLRVHIITDSQVVAHWGTKACQIGEELPRRQIHTWATIREYRRLGYLFRFHWAERMSSGFNWACDLVAGLARVHTRDALAAGEGDFTAKALTAITNVQFLAGEQLGSLYHIHPDDAA
jgi:hypothetical protein